METLEKYFKVTVQQEYEKNPKLKANDVQELLDWSGENINLYGRIIDLQIVMFLHACNYDKEYTKKVMKQYFNLRAKKCSSIFSSRDPDHPFNQKQLDLINININSDDEFNYTYIWWAIKNGDASQYYPTVVAKLTFMAIELDQVECGTKTGYILILDSNRFGLSHALRYSLSLAKNLMSYVQEGTPYVIEKIYILNVTSGIEKIYSTMKPFMSASLINKVVIKTVSKTNNTIKTLPQNIVPRDYGGLAPGMNETTENLRKKLLDNQNFFLDEEKFRNGNIKYDVGKRDVEETNSVQSFKKLDID